ncbi:MAG: VWA domain-containing protein [Spirochaetales bacterium]|nr:VWA domain-containing protein [Spirochaetales bacterium]
MKSRLFVLIFMVSIFFMFSLQSAAAKALIQVGILLDTSNSMDGLIDQAKTQLWKIVNELALSKKNGESPDLQVALYEYGNDNLAQSDGYVRMVVAMTGDLDKISEELFSLTTYGGYEYCGTVIGRAAQELAWSNDPEVYKVIFIAGNEEFTQGSVDYKTSCKQAISKGIIINTIFCGPHDQGVNTGWKDGALLADGTYANIDQDLVTVYIEAPQDAEIVKLGKELNDTYIPYGAEGEKSKVRQEEQDDNAAGASEEAFVQRNMAKANEQYKNSSWDLVDAVANDMVEIEKIEKKDLPAEMQDMSVEERKAYVVAMQTKRDNIKSSIKQLNEERRAYIAEQMKNNAEDNTLGDAMLDALRTQAETKNFEF